MTDENNCVDKLLADLLDDQRRYNKAIMEADTDAAIDIEKKHGLYGYPPEVVSGVISIAHKDCLSMNDAVIVYFGENNGSDG